MYDAAETDVYCNMRQQKGGETMNHFPSYIRRKETPDGF